MNRPLSADAEDAIQTVVNAFEDYRSAWSLASQAEAMWKLTNSISELAKWHHRYNSNTGEIEPRD